MSDICKYRIKVMELTKYDGKKQVHYLAQSKGRWGLWWVDIGINFNYNIRIESAKQEIEEHRSRYATNNLLKVESYK